MIFRPVLLLRHRLRRVSLRLRHAWAMRCRRRARGRRGRLHRVRREQGHAHHARDRHACPRRPPFRRPRAGARAGATYCLHESADVDVPVHAARDGEEIELGNTRVRVLHTPDTRRRASASLVTDLKRGTDPGSC